MELFQRFMSGSSRWWTIRNLAKLALSGVFAVDVRFPISAVSFCMINAWFLSLQLSGLGKL